MKNITKLGVAAAGLLFLDSFILVPNRLKIKQYNMGKGKENLRLVQLSDIHIGPFFPKWKMKALVRTINRLSPDVVVFTGDLYDKYDEYPKPEAAVETLSQIKAPLGKLAIWGNHDCLHMGRYYPSILEQAGFRLLENEAVTFGADLAIGGVDDLLFGKPDIQKTLDAMAGSGFKVLLMHEPDGADGLCDSDVDLILSGHTHGGQIRLPFLPPVTTSMGRKYVKGFYDINENTKLYVSSGIGTTAIPARFRMSPEVGVFDLHLGHPLKA